MDKYICLHKGPWKVQELNTSINMAPYYQDVVSPSFIERDKDGEFLIFNFSPYWYASQYFQKIVSDEELNKYKNEVSIKELSKLVLINPLKMPNELENV